MKSAFTRRLALSGALLSAAAVTSAALIGSAAKAAQVRDIKPPPIKPRQSWARGLFPTGPISAETVKCLAIHHSASSNGYSAGAVPAMLRSFYHHHTSTKGWPDVAYNFFVDAYGTVYEGRVGSLAGPVAGSATGGNQGCTQLCCFVGNFTDQAPTPQASQAMAELVAWLAHRYEIDLNANTVSFTSRGSNKHPAGSIVQVPPVAGHRDLSLTTCPGDAGYAAITTTILPAARAVWQHASKPSTTPTPLSPSTTRQPDAQPHATTTTTDATSTATESSQPPAGPSTSSNLSQEIPSADPSADDSTESDTPTTYVAVGAAVTAIAGGAAYLRRRRPGKEHP